MRNALRDIRAISDKNEAGQKLSAMTSMIDRLAKRGMIHKNKAANLKSGLMKKINAL
jgi:small subunit ribosomal protein S20